MNTAERLDLTRQEMRRLQAKPRLDRDDALTLAAAREQEQQLSAQLEEEQEAQRREERARAAHGGRSVTVGDRLL